MPQKTTRRNTSGNATRKNGSKAPGSKSRSSSGRSSNRSNGRNNGRSSRTSKKPKVYIPAYKVIILCGIIITLCMGLLLLTTLKEPNHKLSDETIQRYKEEIVDSKKQADEIKEVEAPKKTEPVKSESAKKADSSKAAAQKNDAKKQESPKTDSAKIIETPQVKEEKKSAENKAAAAKQKAEAEQKAKADAKAKNEPAKNETAKQADSKAKAKYGFPPAKNGAQLIFVFDDGGQNLSHLKPFLSLPFPITVAVLPQITHSKESAAQVRASGNEVILHQPMQSVNASVNPGPGAIKPDMTEDQIKSPLFQNINEIGPITGMNNHEGSGITADAEKMATVLQFCSQEGIYFLDSRTNVETKVPYVAHELGYSWYERNIFLDNEKTKENALKELKKGLDLANKNGSVIMIGHIWSADFLPAFLQDIYPELKEKGYTFSTVSKSKAKRN